MLLLEHILLYQEQLKDFKLFYTMSGLKRFLEKISSWNFYNFLTRDSLGLLVCCRAHFSVLETVDIVSVAICLRSNHKLTGLKAHPSIIERYLQG